MTTIKNSSQVYANAKSGLGTVGGFFKFPGDNGVYGITNNHVIANANKCHVGDPIYLFGDDDPPMIGTLQYWVTLDANKINYLDIALFKLAEGFEAGWLLPVGNSMPQALEVPVNNDRVYMILPDGSQRNGTITNPVISFNKSFTLCGTDFSFTGLIEIKSADSPPFSKHGESGSLILNSKNNIIGVLLGTNFDQTRSYAVPFMNGKVGISGVYNLSITGSPAITPEDEPV
jgi:hypothetical protein